MAYLIILHLGYTFGDEEKYAMPVSFLADDFELIGQVNPKAFITKIVADGKPGWLIDAIYDFGSRNNYSLIFGETLKPGRKMVRWFIIRAKDLR